MSALPDWDRVCRRIVDGEGKAHTRCVQILKDETGGVFKQLEALDKPAKTGFIDRVLQGEAGSWITLAIPVTALLTYMVISRRSKTAEPPKQVVTAT